MKNLYFRLNNFIEQRPYLLQVVIFFLLIFLTEMVFQPLIYLADYLSPATDKGPSKDKVFIAVIAGPLLETLIFQYGVFKIFEKLKWTSPDKYLWIITISACLFGLSHIYSVAYVVFATGVGFVLAYIYFFYRTDAPRAFWTTAIIHGLHNLAVAFIGA